MNPEIPQYNEEELKLDAAANFNRPYRQCAVSVMDTIADPGIKFDEEGVSNYYHEYKLAERSLVFSGDAGKEKLKEAIGKIKLAGKDNKYDCILGLSGGADSSYLALLAKRNGLRPLVVHFDYGWNLELAVQNIENIVRKLEFDLYTVVMDWEEMKSLQRSYYRASVLDLDVPADHMIFGALYQTAAKFNIKYILSGKNTVTEATLPIAWNYNKFDLVNLKSIHKQFENTSLKKLPRLGIWQFGKYTAVNRIEIIELLDFVDYNKEEVKRTLAEELNWKDYGGKHYENIFTRLYQSYVLPVKFGIDKRKAHLSNLIFSGQLTKDEALKELSKLPYDEKIVVEDIEYVSKKLGFSVPEFIELIKQPSRLHAEFGTDDFHKKLYKLSFKLARPLIKAWKKIK